MTPRLSADDEIDEILDNNFNDYIGSEKHSKHYKNQARQALLALMERRSREAVRNELELLPGWSATNCGCSTCKVVRGRLADLQQSRTDQGGEG